MKLKIVLLFIFVNPFIFSLKPDSDPTSPLYVYDGVCTDEECVPNTPCSFASLWSQYSPSERRNRVNDYINSNPQIFSNKIEARINKDGDLKLFAKEFLNATEILGNYSQFDCILFDTDIHSHHFKKDSELFNYNFPKLKASNVNTRTILNFFTNILIHLYNWKQSKFQDELLMLPEELNLPVITLTSYEKQVLRDREIITDFKKYRERLRYYFDELNKAIDDTFSTNDRQMAFGRQTLDINDFAYAFNIGWMRLTSKSFVPLLFLNNFNHTNSETFGFDEADRDGVGEYRVVANRNYSAGEQLSFSPEENENPYYLMYNVFGDMIINPKDCLSAFVLDEESSKKLILHENHPSSKLK